MIEKYRLVDFCWEFKESIFDSEFNIGKNSLVYGVFLYLDVESGRVLKFKCMVTQDVAQQIERELKQAMLCVKNFEKSVGV